MHEPLEQSLPVLAKAYLPEWNFSKENPDAGSVVALLCQNMLQESRNRFDRVLHKHKIQYLNLFDQFKDEPLEAAKGYVCFTPATGVPEGFQINKGTRLLASAPDISSDIVFETTHPITVSPARITNVYSTRGAEKIVNQVVAAKDDVTQTSFTAFGSTDNNLERHLLYIGFENAFLNLSQIDCKLYFSKNADENASISTKLASDAFAIRVLGEDGFAAFDKVSLQDGVLHLVKDSYIPTKQHLGTVMCYQICIEQLQWCEVSITDVRLELCAKKCIPDSVWVNAFEQNPLCVYPFAMPMEIYAACGMESAEVLSRLGAKAKIDFALRYEVFEQSLPELEVDPELKTIMRTQRQAPKTVSVSIKANAIIIEYLSTSGYKRLVTESPTENIFCSAEGACSIEFTVPADIISHVQDSATPRLRMRLIRCDDLYRVPSRQMVPVIENLSITYSYEDCAIKLSAAKTINNFDQQSILNILQEKRQCQPFYTTEHQSPCIYLGFEEKPQGFPFSLYFVLQNIFDTRLDFSAEYSNEKGFTHLKVFDATNGLQNAGTMLMVIHEDATPKILFGKNLYWIRLICHSQNVPQYRLPLIKGIYTNMAQVENKITQTQLFYVESSAEFEIRLNATGVMDAKIYVNEDNSSNEDNWVLWQNKKTRIQQGRVYNLDSAQGIITFDKGVFSAYPAKTDTASIKIEYQTYRGSVANVAAGAINTTSDSIRYLSSVSNPFAAFGGYDSLNEASSENVISNMLRTRERAVTKQDYFDIIAQASNSVRKIKCLGGVGVYGEADANLVTIAILVEGFEQGGHVFSSVRNELLAKLVQCSALIPAGHELVLVQPRFIQINVRIWISLRHMDKAYDTQQQCQKLIAKFLDPMQGGFTADGWDIGVLPKPAQLIAYLKMHLTDASIDKIIMSALYENREYEVNDTIEGLIQTPFGLAVNGEHNVNCILAEE